MGVGGTAQQGSPSVSGNLGQGKARAISRLKPLLTQNPQWEIGPSLGPGIWPPA